LNGVPQTAVALGYAGVLPFLLATLLVLVPGGHIEPVRTGLLLYSLAIVSFLSGTWWSIALVRAQPVILVISNALVIVAWVAAWLLDNAIALWLMAGLLIAAVTVERGYSMFLPQPAYYRRLRLKLTAIAALSLLMVCLTS